MMRLPSMPQRLAPRIQIGAALALLVVGGAAGTLFYSLHRRELMEGLRETTSTQGALLELGLRHAMLDRDSNFLEQLVRRLGEEPGVEGVHVLDRQGDVRVSSDPGLVGTHFDRSDPTCLLCHRKKPEEKSETAVLRGMGGRRVLRNVNPIRNGPECVGCHAATDRINGVLLVDHSLSGVEARLRTEAVTFAMVTLAALAALATVLGLLLHRLVLRPVARMRAAITAAESGDLDAGLPSGGGDEMSLLADHFNRMSTSLGRTVGRLREREEYLARILNSADDGMVVVDRELHVVAANASYLELCGKETAEVLGQTCCFAPQCRRDHLGDCPSWAAFETGSGQRTIRRILDEDGASRTFEIHASPLEIDGEISQSLEVWRDITERTQMEAELAHSERLASLGFLASGISHEINNPLATITACLDGLQRRLADGTEAGSGAAVVGRYVELIQKEVHRCRDLTGKLMLLAQKSSPLREPVDLNAALAETVSLLEFEAERSGARVVKDLAADLPAFRGDEPRLRQVMLNLLLNALEAVRPGGTVNVQTCVENGVIRIVIRDDGCGIPPGDLERIFEPFYSARPGRRSTGLGLFVSSQIVRHHGGTIEVRSQASEGTEVSVRLPHDRDGRNEGPDLRPPGR